MFEESYVPRNSYVDLEDDSKINELGKALARLVEDGVTYRKKQKELEYTNEVLKAAQKFIKSKGLAEEFNKFCQEVL